MAAIPDPLKVAQVVTLAILITVGSVFGLLATLALIPVWYLVQVAAKLLRPDLGPIISDTSTMFTVNPVDDCAGSICNYMVLDGRMEVERVRQLFHDRIMTVRRPNGEFLFQRFRDTWTEFLGYSFWKPEKNFSLEHHIREYDLDGDLKLPSPCTEEDLKRVMGGIAGRLYRGDRSPWETLLIPNYRMEGSKRPKTVMLTRHHHALIDGYGLVSMMRHLLATDYSLPQARIPQVPLWQRLLAPLRMPFDSALMMLNSADGLKDWHVKDGEPKELVTSMSAPIPVERVKDIKNKLGVGYNAVIHTAIAGAITRMLKEEKQQVPERLGVHFPVPNPNHPGGTVNHAFLVGLDWELKAGSARERLFKIQKRMKNLSRSTVSEMEKLFLLCQIYWPASIRRLTYSMQMGAGGSAVVSTFPVTQDAMDLDGVKVDAIFSCFGAYAHLSLAVLITGLNGKQWVILTGNKRVFRAEAFKSLGAYIEEELDSLMSK